MQKMKKCLPLLLSLAALLLLCVTAFAAESAVEIVAVSTEVMAEGTAEVGAVNMTEAETEDAAKSAADGTAETETEGEEDGTGENGTENTVEDTGETGTDGTVEDTGETGTDGTVEDTGETGTDGTVEDARENGTNGTVEDVGQTKTDGAWQQTDLTGGVVTGFLYEASFRSLEKQTFSYNQTDLEDLFKMLRDFEEVLYCRVLLPNDEETEAMGSAVWNTDDISLDTAGIYSVIATLSPPEGCSFGEGVRTQIVLKVQILGESAPIQITGMADWNPYTLAVAVTQGDTVENITENQLFEYYTTAALRCEDENGGLHYADVSWDFSSLELDETGVYTIWGTPVPPEGTFFAEGLVLAQPSATISVQAAGRPDVNCFYLRYPDILFPWITPPGDYMAATVWLTGEDGGWQELTSVGEAAVSEEEVRLSMNLFTKGENYQMQVDYEGSQTGIFSFLWDDTIVIDGYWEGDRDGDDGDGIAPPGVVQPPPKPDDGNDGGVSSGGSGNGGSNGGSNGSDGNNDGSNDGGGNNDGSNDGGSNGSGSNGGGSNRGNTGSGTLPPAATSAPDSTPALNPAPGLPETAPNPNFNPALNPPPEQISSPKLPSGTKPEKVPGGEGGFMEEVTATSTTISGRRLKMMAEADKGLQFSKQGVSLLLSAGAVADLNIGEEDVFSIEILRENDTAFSFEVQVNGAAVAELKDTYVTLPYRAGGDGPSPSLRHNETGTVTAGSYEAQRGLAVFTVDMAGAYTILEEAASTADSAGPSGPELPVQSEGAVQSEQAATQSEAAAARSKPAPPVLPVVFAAGCLLTVIGGIWFWVRRSEK